MKNLRFLHLTIILFAFVNLAFSQDPSSIEIKIEKVADNVFVLYGSGGNIGICSGKEGLLLIDSQFAELADRIKSELKKINPLPVKYLCNTNWHYDHVSGNEAFADDGATIIAHHLTRKHMVEAVQRDPENKEPVYSETALPVILIDESLRIKINNTDIKIEHIGNAHSDADLIFIFEDANVIHSGDLCFNGGYPFIDVNNGGSIDGMISAAGELISMMDDDTIIIPGHGKLMDINEVRSYRKMLQSIRNNINALIKDGENLEEVLAANPTKEYDSTMAGWVPRDNFVKIVYNSLLAGN